MNKNQKDQPGIRTATVHKSNDNNRTQSDFSAKQKSNDNQISPKGKSTKGKAGMDHENKNHDSDRNKNSK